MSRSSVRSPWFQGHALQLCILVRGIFLQRVKSLLCSICRFLSVWMYFLPPDPSLLSELCWCSSSNFTMGTFLGPVALDTWIQHTDEKSPHSYPVYLIPFSPIFDAWSEREKPLDKIHHILSVVVIQLVAWESGCMAFCLLPMEKRAVVKQEALLKTSVFLLIQLTVKVTGFC